MGYLRTVLNRVRGLLGSLPPSQRFSVAALLGVVAVSLVMVVMWQGRDSYQPVLSDLSGDQMTGIQQALKGSGIDYRFRDSTLFVAAGRSDGVLMMLTEKGALPSDISASFGFEDLVAPQGFSLKTTEQRQMEFNIALGNMLGRDIATTPTIAKAQVHIATSKAGFMAEKKSTAAVNFTPHGSQRVSETTLSGICYLVAASVGPALPPEAVVVRNSATGEAYRMGDDGSSFVTASSRMELQQSLDEYYREQVEEFLRPVLGQVHALVHVDMDVTSRQQSDVEWETTKKKTMDVEESDGGPQGGATLVTPNTAATVMTGSAGTGKRSETHEKEETKSPSKTSTTIIPPGEVKGIQITVMADLTRVTENIRVKDGLEAEDTVSNERLQTEYAYYEEKLKTGLPVARGGGSTNVSSVTFSAEPYSDVQLRVAAVADVGAAGRLVDGMNGNWQKLMLVGLAMCALFMMKSVAKPRVMDDDALDALKQDEEEEDDESLLPEITVDIEEKRARAMRSSIEEMLERDPSSAMSLIKRWITTESK